MGADRLGDPGPPGDPSDDPSRAVTVEATTVRCGEDRSGAAFADREVHGPGRARRQRDGDGLASLAQHRPGPMPPLDAEGLDVRPDGFGHPQPVEGQQRDQGVLAGRTEDLGDEQGADLVAVQADGLDLVVDPGTAGMDSRGVRDRAFLFCVAVEAGIITVTVVIRAATEKEGTSEHGHRSDAARDQHGQAVHLVGTAGEAVDGTGDDEDRERKKPAGVDRCRIAGSSGGAAGTRNIPFFSTRASGDAPVPGACSPSKTPPSTASTSCSASMPTPRSVEIDGGLGTTLPSRRRERPAVLEAMVEPLVDVRNGDALPAPLATHEPGELVSLGLGQPSVRILEIQTGARRPRGSEPLVLGHRSRPSYRLTPEKNGPQRRGRRQRRQVATAGHDLQVTSGAALDRDLRHHRGDLVVHLAPHKLDGVGERGKWPQVVLVDRFDEDGPQDTESVPVIGRAILHP